MRGRLHHVCFHYTSVQHLFDLAELAKEAGIAIETGPARHGIGGATFLYMLEPGGNRVALMGDPGYMIFDPAWRTVIWKGSEVPNVGAVLDRFPCARIVLELRDAGGGGAGAASPEVVAALIEGLEEGLIPGEGCRLIGGGEGRGGRKGGGGGGGWGEEGGGGKGEEGGKEEGEGEKRGGEGEGRGGRREERGRRNARVVGALVFKRPTESQALGSTGS